MERRVLGLKREKCSYEYAGPLRIYIERQLTWGGPPCSVQLLLTVKELFSYLLLVRTFNFDGSFG